MSSAWFHIWDSKIDPSLRLFCFPYAGGGASAFRDWVSFLPDDVELVALQLPGRENRINEPPYTELPLLINQLQISITSFLDVPSVFFGHSMGGTTAYELAYHLHQCGMTLPMRLVLSGSKTPHTPNRRPIMYSLPEQEFKQRLMEMNGTPPDLLHNQELMDLLGPTLRADMQLVETWNREVSYPLEIPITVLGGETDEEVWHSELIEWEQYTNNEFEIFMFEGDHFFLHSEFPSVIGCINQTLKRVMRNL